MSGIQGKLCMLGHSMTELLTWSQNFRGVTQAEINRANGITPAAVGFERPLLSKPSKEGNYFGSKISEEDPEAIMTGVTRTLLSEYEDNSYVTYPLGYYKAITLSSSKQKQVVPLGIWRRNFRSFND